LAALLQSSPEGISQSEANHQLTRFGRNELSLQTSFGWISILLNRWWRRIWRRPSESLLTGRDLNSFSDEAPWHLAKKIAVFAEVDSGQKERIIQALKRTGYVVGSMGDGINDSPVLRAANVSISLENAADVARDAAEIVLLQPDMNIPRDGIDEGRKTFANTQKYILITNSANFGNLLSMAAASFSAASGLTDPAE
jgi:magnesium-transporting ATPase (P-type)